MKYLLVDPVNENGVCEAVILDTSTRTARWLRETDELEELLGADGDYLDEYIATLSEKDFLPAKEIDSNLSIKDMSRMMYLEGYVTYAQHD